MFNSGEIEEGLPPFGLPPFSTISHNETRNFEDMASTFGTSLFSIPFISFLETVATAKSFCEYSCKQTVFVVTNRDGN
jgi:MFS superfamily sulfate permease-like transporter